MKLSALLGRSPSLMWTVGLGKTVESIALILLNRHPLSTKRIEPAAADAPDALRGSSKLIPRKSPFKIPTIDLSRGLELLDPDLHDWWSKEKEAFKNAVIPDKGAAGNVSQVAVSRVV